MVAPQATTKHYDASDGVSANLDGVDVRNAIVVSEDGELGNLVVTMVNTNSTRAEVSVQFDSSGTKTTETVTLPASSSTAFGLPDGETITLVDMGVKVGSLIPIYFQSGDGEGQEVLVPVLDNTLAEYSELLPTAQPTQAPAVKAPATEAPASEAPATEAPATEAPTAG